MERKQYFDVFNWRRKWKGKPLGLQCFIFSPAHQNATPQFKVKTQEKMGTKWYCLKKTKITICCRFCFYYIFLLSIFFFFVFFCYFSFVCLFYFTIFSSFDLDFCVCFFSLFFSFPHLYIYIYIYINEVHIHTQFF